MKVIGIDLGTTSISGVIFDADRKLVIKSRTVENDSFIETENEWERVQNAEMLSQKAVGLTDALLARCPDAGAIGLTGQMHGIVYVDSHGSLCSPLYTWQDGRGETLVELAREKTGLLTATGYGLLTHLYNLREGLVPPAATSLCTIGDYLGMILTGSKTPRIHASNAASLGFFDSRNGAFFEDALKIMKIDTRILPQLAEDNTVLGTYRGIPVTVAIGDNQASFLGAVGMEKNTALLNMGTGGQISVLSDRYFETPGIEARPFFDGQYLLAGSSLCGGRAYALLEHFFRSYLQRCGLPAPSQYDRMAELAEDGRKRKDQMKVRTTFSGTRIDPQLRGSITNLSEDNFTPEGLTYGILEGMAGELFALYELIRSGTEMEAKHLVASGNGFRHNPVLQDICREKFGADLTLSVFQEEAACGAAIHAAMATLKNEESLGKV